MPIPFKPIDFSDVKPFDGHITDANTDEIQAAKRRGMEYLKTWLSWYDSDGRLKPEALLHLGDDYMPNMDYGFLSMSEEDRRAYIVAEQQRLCIME